MNFIELGVLTALTLGNTPYPDKTTGWPKLTLHLEKSKLGYVEIINSARINPQAINRLNPITGLWQVEAGKNMGRFHFSAGHQSEHEIGAKDKLTESFDYIDMRYRIEF